MDQDSRVARLTGMLDANRALRARLVLQCAHLRSHHGSRERDRNLLHASKTLERAEKLRRSLERALHNEGKLHPA